MKHIIDALNANSRVSDYKINVHRKESYELFFVKGKLETVRCTDTCDREVTVYVDHGKFKGDAQFFVYPYTTVEMLEDLVEEAVGKALLIENEFYTLPSREQGVYQVESNFADLSPAELAAKVSNAVFAANSIDHAALNAVEVFVNKHTESVVNSRGLDKTQTRYDAMVEAIPTYNGEAQSVELYEAYNFSNFNLEDLTAEIAGKMAQVRARYEAVTPEHPLDCKVILNKQELNQLFWSIASHFDYESVYGHYNLFGKGDAVQSDPQGDIIGMTVTGEVPGNFRSRKFDADGLSLTPVRIVDKGVGVNYYGSNRCGQYLGEVPTGDLSCLCVDAGTAPLEAFSGGPYLEVVSMSGLQVDFYSDYIGGEIRLAYYHDGTSTIPVTGISISGKLSDVLNHIRLSQIIGSHRGYTGPEKAILSDVKIF